MEKKENKKLKTAIAEQFGNVLRLCRFWPGLRRRSCNVYNLINLKESPFCATTGRYRNVCMMLSEALGFLPEELFDSELYGHLIPSWVKQPIRVPMARLAKVAVAPPDFIEQVENGVEPQSPLHWATKEI